LTAALSRNLSIKDDARYNIPVQRVFKGKPSRLDLIFQRFDAPVYFITFNTRPSLLATPRVHAVFIEYGLSAGDFRIGVGRYVLMPDHIHLFV
jgi:REP-associated tyrosine transposase